MIFKDANHKFQIIGLIVILKEFYSAYQNRANQLAD